MDAIAYHVEVQETHAIEASIIHSRTTPDHFPGLPELSGVIRDAMGFCGLIYLMMYDGIIPVYPRFTSRMIPV